MDGHILAFHVTPKGGKIKYTSNKEEFGDITPRTHNVSIDRKPSGNLSTIFRCLLAHALLWSGIDMDFTEEDLKKRSIADSIKHKGYIMKGFSISGNDETEGISFNVEFLNRDGLTTKISTPKLPFNLNVYPYVKILREDLSHVFSEIKSYNEGLEYAQMQLEFDEL